MTAWTARWFRNGTCWFFVVTDEKDQLWLSCTAALNGSGEPPFGAVVMADAGWIPVPGTDWHEAAGTWSRPVTPDSPATEALMRGSLGLA